MKTDKEKLAAIVKYLKTTRKEINKCVRNNNEYTTTLGNRINCCEASSMFAEVQKEIGDILES